MRQNSETRRLLDIAEPVCLDAGYELLDVRLKRDQRGAVLQLFIERIADPDGSSTKGIGIEDCERVSRELGAVFDVEDALDYQYSLEVSSPGLDRPLRTAKHFEQFVGSEAKVTLDVGVDGRRRFTGRLVSVVADSAADDANSDTTFVNIDVDGTEYSLPLTDIESAQIVPDWGRLLQKTSGAS